MVLICLIYRLNLNFSDRWDRQRNNKKNIQKTKQMMQHGGGGLDTRICHPTKQPKFRKNKKGLEIVS